MDSGTLLRWLVEEEITGQRATCEGTDFSCKGPTTPCHHFVVQTVTGPHARNHNFVFSEIGPILVESDITRFLPLVRG